ncbi:MAG: hypothetical protein IPK79_04495 [Vampirovibrionales bacterium]|nr:hypothetical protein [Vampirovibrionales bacterium]
MNMTIAPRFSGRVVLDPSLKRDAGLRKAQQAAARTAKDLLPVDIELRYSHKRHENSDAPARGADGGDPPVQVIEAVRIKRKGLPFWKKTVSEKLLGSYHAPTAPHPHPAEPPLAFIQRVIEEVVAELRQEAQALCPSACGG